MINTDFYLCLTICAIFIDSNNNNGKSFLERSKWADTLHVSGTCRAIRGVYIFQSQLFFASLLWDYGILCFPLRNFRLENLRGWVYHVNREVMSFLTVNDHGSFIQSLTSKDPAGCQAENEKKSFIWCLLLLGGHVAQQPGRLLFAATDSHNSLSILRVHRGDNAWCNITNSNCTLKCQATLSLIPVKKERTLKFSLFSRPQTHHQRETPTKLPIVQLVMKFMMAAPSWRSL